MHGGTIAPADATVSLRPSGMGRYFEAAFLAVWLCGWTVGEAVAGAVFVAAIVCLGSMAAGGSVCDDPPKWAGEATSSIVLFLAVWLTFWTFGGIAAWTQLLRSLWGEDRLQLVPEGLCVVRRAGPFKRVRTFDRGVMRRVRIRPRDKAIVLDTMTGVEVLSAFGTIDERAAVLTWLRDGLRLPGDGMARAAPESPPAEYEVQHESGGWRMMRPTLHARSQQALVMWIVTAVAWLGWIFRSKPTGGLALAMLFVVLLLAAGAGWLSWGRTEWLVQPGELRFRRRLGSWSREQSFAAPARLEITHSTDSDGDDRFKLAIGNGTVRRTIATALYDPDDVVHVGRWLASRTGLPIDVPAGVETPS